MTNIKQIIFCVIIFAQPATIFAQGGDRLTLSLKEAQEVALKNNYQHKNASIDVAIADRKIWETTASGLPQISSSVDFQAILNELPTLSFGGMPPVKVGEKVNATFKVTASQLVFSGPYIVGLQASKAYKSLSEISLQKTEIDIISKVASSYYTLLLLEENKAILDSSVINIRQSLKETNELKKAGFVEEVVADQLSVSLSLVESAASEISQQIHSVKNLLKFQAGIDQNQEIILSDKLQNLFEGFNPENFAERKLDPQKNIDLKLMSNQVDLTNLQLKLEKSTFLPNVAAFVMLQKQAKEPKINFTPTAVAGVSLSLPIFSSGLRRSKVQQAQMQLEKSKNTYEQVKQSLEMELNDATSQLDVAWQKYQSQKQNMELAKKVYNNYRVKYSKGVSSQQDVIQANDKYLQAVGSYTGAVVALFNARLRVDKVLGNL